MTPRALPATCRWCILVLVGLALLGLNILWFAPAPLLAFILKDLRIDLMQGGLVMSAVCLAMAGSSLLEGRLAGVATMKQRFSMGMWLMGLGATLPACAGGFGGLLASRIAVGIGFGLCIPIAGGLIMAWFPERERPLINTLIAMLPYVATTATYGLTIPLFHLLRDSWRLTLAAPGILVLILAASWQSWGAERPARGRLPAQGGGEQASRVWQLVIRNRETRLLMLAEMGDMWSFQFLTSFLPAHLVMNGGMDMARASGLTALFPLAGIAGGLAGGFAMSRTGLRRPFTWPMHLLIFCGTLLILRGEGPFRLAGILLAGFGNAAWAPALYTMPMEFDRATPEGTATVYSLVFSMGFLSAFLSPWLGGWLAERWGLQAVMFLFSCSSLVAAYCTYRMRETGTRAVVGSGDGGEEGSCA